MVCLVSVIIVNYNGKQYLEKCLASLSDIKYDNYEIILVDNNSDDSSVEFVQKNFSPVKIIQLDSNHGFAEPNNIGVKNAKGDLLLFLNNDTVVEPDFLGELVSAMSDPKTAICQSMLLKPNGDVDSSGDFIDSIGVTFSTFEKITETREIFSAKAASMLVRRDIFERLGGFDEKFFVSFEDIDLSWRARILGYKILINPKSIVYHVGGQTIKKIREEVIFHGFKNQLILKLTNFETGYSVKSMVVFFFYYGTRMLRVLLDYMIKGHTKISATRYEPAIAQRPNIKIMIKGIFWILRNYSYIREKHRQVNSARVVSTQEMKRQRLIV